MAAGKIFNATASRRRYRRRRATGFKKSVAKIAKNVVMRQAETRCGDITYQSAYGTNGYFRGIFTNISKGDNQENRDGDVLKSMGVWIRGALSLDPAVVTQNYDTIAYRFLVFSSKRPLSTLTDAGISFWNSGLDPEKITVHYDAIRKYNNDGRIHTYKKWVSFKRNVTYEPTSNTVIKNELYFAVIPYPTIAVTGMTATTGNYVNFVMQPKWKDL